MVRRVVLVGLALIGLSLAGQNEIAAGAPQADLPPAVVGTTWQLVTLQVAGSPAEDVSGAGLTITFGTDGQASGSGGCNQFTGGYTADMNGALQFSPLAATRKSCGQTVDDRELRYLMALQATTGYVVDGTTGLRLVSGQQGAALVFRRANPAVPLTGGGGMARGSELSLLAVTLMLTGVLLVVSIVLRRWRGYAWRH